MERVKQILRHYGLGNYGVLNYKSYSHGPDMRSETFEVGDKKYLLVEIEAVGDDLLDEEYARLETDLHIKRSDLKLTMPKPDQAHTIDNKGSIGIEDSDTTLVLFEVQVTANYNLLTEDEVQKVEWGKALDKDYFYVPAIYYSESTSNGEQDWYSLRFNNQEPPASLMFYASKVPAGKTLWQAVRHDLESDFKYPHDKSFVIEEVEPFDTARTKDGKELTRFLVWVGVYEKFDTTGISPVGTHPFWVYEGEDTFNPI